MSPLKDLPYDKSSVSYKLTPEQEFAVHLAVTQQDNLKINALAGTGKTSTLRAIAKHLPRQKILYLAFNKAVQMEASTSFPPNVFARTIHSLAYRSMGIFDPSWQKKLAARCTLKDYAAFLGMDLRAPRAMKSIFCLREAIKEFQNSSDLLPSSKHIPPSEWQNVKSLSEKTWISDLVDKQAPRFWKSMIDPRQESFAITHDTYLKLWQLTGPRIIGTDIIMLDEAQDANPVMMDILQAQKIRLILVGDTWQQIYSFRGAINAMQNIKTPLECFLTQSFRFGQEIADLANSVLQMRAAPKTLRGHPTKLSYLGPLPSKRKHTIIFRYNIELLEEALDLASKKFRIHVVGSLEHTAALVTDVYYLYAKERSSIRDAKLKTFKNWDELEANFDILDDLELKKSFRFVERYGHEIPIIISTVKKADALSPEASDCILTTGHKSKGQEWDCVRISEDFYEAVQDEDDEELNLLYVAITRAIQYLEVPPKILEWLDLSIKEKTYKKQEFSLPYKAPNFDKDSLCLNSKTDF